MKRYYKHNHRWRRCADLSPLLQFRRLNINGSLKMVRADCDLVFVPSSGQSLHMPPRPHQRRRWIAEHLLRKFVSREENPLSALIQGSFLYRDTWRKLWNRILGAGEAQTLHSHHWVRMGEKQKTSLQLSFHSHSQQLNALTMTCSDSSVIILLDCALLRSAQYMDYIL